MDNQSLKELIKRDDQQAFVEAYAEQVVSSHEDEFAAKATPLQTKEQLRAREKEQIKATISSEETDHLLYDGLKVLMSNHFGVISQQEQELVQLETEKFLENPLIEKAQDPSFDMEGYLDGKEVKDIFGLTDEGMELMYRLGLEYMALHEYTKSYPIFYLLVWLDASNGMYWHTMGVSHCIAEDYEGAISFFDIAKVLDPNNLLIAVTLIECHMLLENFTKAEEELEAFNRELMERPGERDKWQERVEKLRGLMAEVQ